MEFTALSSSLSSRLWGRVPMGARPSARCHPGHRAGAGSEEGRTSARKRKQTQMCLAGAGREKGVLAPTPPPPGARGPCPLSGVSPGAPLAFSLSLLLFLGLPGSRPLALALWSIPGPPAATFFFPGVKTSLAGGRLLAAVIGRRPARRPRPRAPLRPPTPGESGGGGGGGGAFGGERACV